MIMIRKPYDFMTLSSRVHVRGGSGGNVECCLRSEPERHGISILTFRNLHDVEEQELKNSMMSLLPGDCRRSTSNLPWLIFLNSGL